MACTLLIKMNKFRLSFGAVSLQRQNQFLHEMDNLIKSVFHKSEYSIIVFLFPLQQGDLQEMRMLKQQMLQKQTD